LGYKAIAKQFHVPIPTIQFIVKKYKMFYTVSTLKGRGRKLKVDPRLARKLVRHVTDNPRITSKELLDQTIESGVQLSMKTLKRILNKAGLRGCRPRTNPLHMPRHLQSCFFLVQMLFGKDLHIVINSRGSLSGAGFLCDFFGQNMSFLCGWN